MHARHAKEEKRGFAVRRYAISRREGMNDSVLFRVVAPQEKCAARAFAARKLLANQHCDSFVNVSPAFVLVLAGWPVTIVTHISVSIR